MFDESVHIQEVLSEHSLSTHHGREGNGREWKEDTLVASKLPVCPHDQIINLYHVHLPTLPKVRIWTEKRKKHLAARWNEDPDRQSLEFWEKFFKYVATSDFLTGRTGKFEANLEWLVNQTNFVKVFEGNYDNRNQSNERG